MRAIVQRVKRAKVNVNKEKISEIGKGLLVFIAVGTEDDERDLEYMCEKMAINGYIIQVGHSDIKKMTAEIQKIGVNINQIAKRANATGNVYQKDIEEIKGALKEIWRL